MADETRDDDLMRRVKAGDADAFATLYHRHKGGLLSFCYQMLRNWEDAGDVLQDAFRYVYTRASTYRPAAKFTTYLYHIARNMCIDILRRRKRWNLQQLVDVPDESPEQPSHLERREANAGIKAALAEVPEPYREVLHLRLMQGLTYDEITGVLECPIGTVKSRLHQALELLRQALRRKRIAE